MKNSSRPLILAGGGVRSSKATRELFDFAHITGIPVVVSLMGLDSFPHDDPLYIGMIGHTETGMQIYPLPMQI